MSENTIPIVREGRLDDAPTIAAFNAAMAMETERRELDQATAQSGAEAVLLDPLNGFYLIALKDEAPVGSLLVTFEWSDWQNATHWWIQSVYVLPKHRGTGVYKSLYEHVKQRAKLRGNVCDIRLYVEKENQIAQDAYARLGMHQAPYLVFEEALNQP